jgi:hypothetical protein
MDRARRPSSHLLLTRLFLRQFLENDLVSPDSDRSQLLAVVGAMVVSLTLFISVVMSASYVQTLTPGQAAVMALDDRFFYLALSMLVTALVATSQWDALVVGARDAAILEPLPLPAATIRAAKMAAVAILGAAVAIAVNGFPSVVFPWLLVFNFREVSVITLFGLMLVHAAFTVSAAVFGYLVIIACRETLSAALGARWFHRVSPWAQGALIVALGGSLLLLPAAADRIAQRGPDDWRTMVPPMWFLGAYELAAGTVIADLPRGIMTPRQRVADQAASARYDARRPYFPGFARRAGMAVGLTLLIAIVAYMWNARRLPALTPPIPAAPRRRWTHGRRLVNAFILRQAAARAGFYFSLAAMWRSSTHRLTLACAAAAGLAMSVVALSNVDVQGGVASARLLSMQPLLYGALLVGFRHIIRVPAELRANWGFQLAWRGRERAFVAGVKGAALVGLVFPALAVLLPLYLSVLGIERALLHAALGLAGAVVLLEALMAGYEKVPFTCTYLPSENTKALAPIYIIAFLIGASMFARMQYAALYGAGMFNVLTTLAVLFALLKVSASRRAPLVRVDFDEVPATYQRLGLDA